MAHDGILWGTIGPGFECFLGNQRGRENQAQARQYVHLPPFLRRKSWRLASPPAEKNASFEIFVAGRTGGPLGPVAAPVLCVFGGNQRGRENLIRRKPPAFNATTGEEERARNRAASSDTGQGMPWQNLAEARRRGDSLTIASGVWFLMGWTFLLSKGAPRGRGRREWRGGRGTHLC